MALCAEALSTQSLGLSPSSPGSGFGKSLWKMHSSLPRAALAAVTCLGEHLAPQVSGSIHVTLSATGAVTSIPGCPGVLATSTALVPPAVPGGFYPLDFEALGDPQGWGQDGAGGGGKVWSFRLHPRGCPGSPLPEQGGRADFSPGHRWRCVGSCTGALSAGCLLARCVRAPGCQAPLLGAGNAPQLWDGTGLFSLPKTSGAVLFQKLSGQDLSPEASQELARESLCRLSWLLEQHEAVGTDVSCCESQLQQHGEH